MSSSVVSSWLDRLSEAEEEHLATPVASVKAAHVSRKRKAEEILKADEDLENYQALESRSLEPFLSMSGSTMSGSPAKKRKAGDQTASYEPPSRTTPLSARESLRSGPTSSKPSQDLIQGYLMYAIPAVTRVSELQLDRVSPRGLALYNYLQNASLPPYLPGSLKVSKASFHIHVSSRANMCTEDHS